MYLKGSVHTFMAFDLENKNYHRKLFVKLQCGGTLDTMRRLHVRERIYMLELQQNLG